MNLFGTQIAVLSLIKYASTAFAPLRSSMLNAGPLATTSHSVCSTIVSHMWQPGSLIDQHYVFNLARILGLRPVSPLPPTTIITNTYSSSFQSAYFVLSITSVLSVSSNDARITFATPPLQVRLPFFFQPPVCCQSS